MILVLLKSQLIVLTMKLGGVKIGGFYNDETSKIFYYKYELDSKQNWIKCIVYSEENNYPVLIKERKITYY